MFGDAPVIETSKRPADAGLFFSFYDRREIVFRRVLPEVGLDKHRLIIANIGIFALQQRVKVRSSQ
jgi:hypothetical protein